jgi:hypothetical protein
MHRELAPAGRNREARGASPWLAGPQRFESPGGATSPLRAESMSPLPGLLDSSAQLPGAYAPGYTMSLLRSCIAIVLALAVLVPHCALAQDDNPFGDLGDASVGRRDGR